MTRHKIGWTIIIATAVAAFSHSATYAASRYAESGPMVYVTPTDGFAWINPTGIEIQDGSTKYLYLYTQGGPNGPDLCAIPGNPQRTGDAIFAWRAVINAQGNPGQWQLVGRVSPCVPPPAAAPAPMAFFGLGQVFRAKVNGSSRYFLLASASNAGVFKEVWLGSSPNGYDWDWEVSSLPSSTEQEEFYGSHTVRAIGGKAFLRSDHPQVSVNQPVLLSTSPNTNNARWWGFENFAHFWPPRFTRLRVLWDSGSPQLQIMNGVNAGQPTYSTLQGDAGAYAVLEDIPLSLGDARVNSLRYSKKEQAYELWGTATTEEVPYNSNNVSCNTSTLVTCLLPSTPACPTGCSTYDGVCVPYMQQAVAFEVNTAPPGSIPKGTRLEFWDVSETHIDSAWHSVGSYIRYLPSGYETARLFPFVWDAPSGATYLYSVTNDLHICTEFLFNPFYKTYVTQTVLNWLP